MPATSRAFVKVSIVCLILGAVLGALLLVNRWLPLDPRIAALKGSHVQLLVVGWLTQLILGVAWWLFPPLALRPQADGSRAPRRGQAQRGNEPLFWATFVLLNTGVLLRVIFEPMQAWTRVEFFGFLAGISGTLLVIAAIAFVANMWGRVRELGQRK